MVDAPKTGRHPSYARNWYTVSLVSTTERKLMYTHWDWSRCTRGGKLGISILRPRISKVKFGQFLGTGRMIPGY
eukprot:482748-Rhodomonas_salina.1